MTPNFHGAINRPFFIKEISTYFKVTPIVALLGPRQCGKTTLSKEFIQKQPSFSPENYFDLENDRDLERLKDPPLTFSRLKGLIVIDEISSQINENDFHKIWEKMKN